MNLMDKRKLRILFNSNSPHSTSGYGSQAHDLLPRIQNAGFDTACIGFYGLEGNRIKWKCQQECCRGKWPEIDIYPKINDAWGGDAILPHSQDFKADVVFTLQDIWVLHPDMLKQIPRWIGIIPIDHDPVPPAIVQRARLAYRIVTYSEFGRKQLTKQGLYSTYIQHTVDTTIFKPEKDKAAVKASLGVPPDTFLFGMVGANKDNPPRKSFQEALDAFRMFHDKNPKSAIYFHTLLQQPGGFPIQDYAKFLGLEKCLYHLQPYEQMFKVDRTGMAKIYNAFDVLLMPTSNGGFEVPIIESMACGVPVITHNFTAMPELVPEDCGWIVKSLEGPNGRRFTPLQSYVGIPDTRDIYEKMEEAARSNLVKMGKACRKHTVENYDSDNIFEDKWLPLFNRLEQEVYPV